MFARLHAWFRSLFKPAYRPERHYMRGPSGRR